MSAADVHVYDFIIVGAGPGGLQMAYYLQKAGLNYIVLESGDSPGSFFKIYPRHRKLISNNKVYTGFDDGEKNLRWDWNSLLCDDESLLFKNYSTDYFPKADAIVEYLRDFAERYDLNIRCGTRVRSVRRDEKFAVEDADGNVYRASGLIVATGRPRPVIPDVPGIEFAEDYSEVSVDPNDFKNQRVMVVGKGNSGFETADNMSETAAVIHLISPHPVRLAWRTHYVGDLRALNNHFLDTYQLKSQNTILDAELESIEKRPDGKLSVKFVYTHAEQQRWEVVVDRIITCTGFRLDDSIFDHDSCRPETSHGGRYPLLTSEWESVNVPDLYFVGTLMHGRDYRKSFSGFIHGFRYNVECLSRLLLYKYRGKELEGSRITPDARSVTRELIARVNHVSSLFQQPGFLADLILIGEGEESCTYFKDLPLDYVVDSPLFKDRRYLTLTLEYGHLEEDIDPFNIYRYPAKGETSVFIHPVIRYFAGGEMVSEHHIPEDLENEWDKEVYLSPCAEFIERVLG